MRAIRRGRVLFKGQPAGVIEEAESAYRFTYDQAFLEGGIPIAVAFPLRAEPFKDERLFPFFRELLPEGWFKEIVCRTLKIDERDEFGILLGSCRDCIGAVSVEEQP